jgi:hypothetical protein
VIDPKKQFVAKVRAFKETLEKKHSRPYQGGREILITRDELYAAVEKKFSIPRDQVSYYFTWSRSCTHPWSKGACENCPPVDHLYVPV